MPRGRRRSSLPPAFQTLRHTCCPTVRYGSIRVVYHRMLMEYPPIKLLALFFILPTFISTVEFCCSPRLNPPLQLLTKHGYAAEARYFFTGKGPDQPIRDSHLPFNATSHPEKPTPSRPRDQMVISVPRTCRTPCSPELDRTMRGWFGA